MTWKRRTLAVLCFAVMALGFYANGGGYVTPQNIIVLLAFFGPLTILGLYCRLGLKMPLALFFRFVPLPFGLLLSAFFISVGLRYEHPFVLGGLIAALAGGCLATVGINLKIEAVRMFARPRAISLVVVLGLALLMPLGIVLWSVESAALRHFWSPINLGIAVAAFGTLYFAIESKQSPLDRAQSASLNAVLLITGFLVYEYFVGLARVEFSEWTAILTAQNVLTLVTAFSIYFVVVFLSICHNQIHQLPTRHWHLVETFLFFVFMVIAPESILELEVDQMSQDDLDEISLRE
ncbi:MAG: hypothetical protein HN579_10875 [Gammaproteobacteria bacterium]|nr:hypothetical protein [Gammaproteobacteria bacterium]